MGTADDVTRSELFIFSAVPTTCIFAVEPLTGALKNCAKMKFVSPLRSGGLCIMSLDFRGAEAATADLARFFKFAFALE
jgi:hypothetical protein